MCVILSQNRTYSTYVSSAGMNGYVLSWKLQLKPGSRGAVNRYGSKAPPIHRSTRSVQHFSGGTPWNIS
jgi:hypothetical protein